MYEDTTDENKKLAMCSTEECEFPVAGMKSDLGEVLEELINTDDTNSCLKSLGKVTCHLKEKPNGIDSRSAANVLTRLYLSAPTGSPVRRAIVGSLQSLADVLRDEVVTVLETEVAKLLHVHAPCDDGSSRTSLLTLANSQPARNTLLIVANLLENFPIGEKCCCKLWEPVVNFLTRYAESYCHSISIADSSTQASELMHQFLLVIQTYNKLVRKAIAHIQNTLRTNPDRLNMLVNGFQLFCQVTANESYLLDCRIACGIGIPLIMMSAVSADLVYQVVFKMFPKYLPPTDIEQSRDAGILPVIPPMPASSYLCLLNGILAVLCIEDLTHEYSVHHTLLLDVVAPEILTLSTEQQDANVKLMVSRSLVQLTNKMSAALLLDTHPGNSVLRSCLHGDANIPKQLITYTWMHCEDTVDIVRMNSRAIFENVLLCHLRSSKEDPKTSAYLQKLIQSLMEQGWHMKGKYGSLSCLVKHVGASHMLQLYPDLPAQLLRHTSQQSLAKYVGELLEKMFTLHLAELKAEGGPETLLSTWDLTWVKPILTLLCSHKPPTTTYITEYVLPKLMKINKRVIRYITAELSTVLTDGTLGALVTCLKKAKSAGVLQASKSSSDESLWLGVVPVTMMKKALCNVEQQIRLDAFGLLCEHHKTTEVVSQLDLDLVQFFLRYNMASQLPAFRQSLVAFLKKLLFRLRESGRVLQRKCQDAVKKGKEDVASAAHLARYQTFLASVCDQIFDCLHPGAAFPSRTTALSLMAMMTDVMATKRTGSRDWEYPLENSLDASRVQTLLECLVDTFEQNKSEAFFILSALPRDSLLLQIGKLEDRFTICMELVCSTRPQDGTTAAFLLRLLIQLPQLQPVAIKKLESLSKQTVKSSTPDVTSGCPLTDQTMMKNELKQVSPKDVDESVCDVRERGCLRVLEVLLSLLREQMGVAEMSLLHASATRPLYPVMHCIRYLLIDADLSAVQSSRQWRHLLADLINACLSIASLVSPVVSNISPEGNIPEDSCLGPGLTLDSLKITEDERDFLKRATASVNKVHMMPEYLVVCCWRSIKEVSLILGQVIQTAPIIHPECADTGLLSIQQLHIVGDYFTTQLLEARHRGAFELAYAGFVKMTDTLWRCKIAEVHGLPRKWLREVLNDVRSRDPDSRLCSTRRSAGLPFYVQALVSTEQSTGGRLCFKDVMAELLLLANPQLPETEKEDSAQVHALNIMRALYRDTRLGDDVFPYIADGLMAAIQGYGSQLWGIRNASTLLFTALMTRIFGVKKSKEDLCKKNCLTGRVFFHRFPAQFEYLLQLLKDGTRQIKDTGRLHLHPRLYPVLLVLGRLFPSLVEGSDPNLCLAAFVPFVMRCAHSPVYKTRLAAARALRPLLEKDHVARVLTDLVTSLPLHFADCRSHNHLHGVLLQIEEILKDLPDLPPWLQREAYNILVPGLHHTQWIFTRSNTCYITRTAYARLTFSIVSKPWPDVDGALGKLVSDVCREALSAFTAPLTHSCSPGFIEFHQLVVDQWLHLVVNQEDHVTWLDLSPEVILTLLKSKLYEIRLTVLKFINSSIEGATERCLISSTTLGKFDNIFNSNEFFFGKSHSLDTVAKMLYESDEIFRQLVSMVTQEEDYAECLYLVLLVLSKIQTSERLPWRTAYNTWSAAQIMKHLFSMKNHIRDEVRCGVLLLSSCLVPTVYQAACKGNKDEQYVLCKWLHLLEDCCSTEQSVELRQATATALLRNASIMLLDTHNGLGENVFRLWTVLVRLLQDEDVTIRELSALVVNHINTTVPEQYRELCGQHIHPSLALEICMSSMVNCFRERDWTGCHSTLLTWVLQDLQPDLPTQASEVRLFDKGEMNTYMDEVSFVRSARHHLDALVAEAGHERAKPTSHLRSLLPSGSLIPVRHHSIADSSVGRSSSGQGSRNTALQSDFIPAARCRRDDAGFQEVCEAPTGYCPFLQQTHYQHQSISLYRHLTAMECLASDTTLHYSWITDLTACRELLSQSYPAPNYLLKQVLGLKNKNTS